MDKELAEKLDEIIDLLRRVVYPPVQFTVNMPSLSDDELAACSSM